MTDKTRQLQRLQELSDEIKNLKVGNLQELQELADQVEKLKERTKCLYGDDSEVIRKNAQTVTVSEGYNIIYPQGFMVGYTKCVATIKVHVDKARKGKVVATVTGTADIGAIHIPVVMR